MLKLGAFENSLRGGPDISPSVSGATATTKTIVNHHRSCTGEHHGSGIEKWKRMRGSKPPHHHHHHHRNTVFSHHTGSASQCSATSLECSDSDSGQESLTSPLRASKTTLQSQCSFNAEDMANGDSNHEYFACDGHINKTSQRLYSTPTKSSAAKTASHVNGHFDEDEIGASKMAEHEGCVIPKNDSYGTDELTSDTPTGVRRHSAKTLALEGDENINSRLSTRRKKRNDRITEHVEGSPRRSALKTGGAEEEHVRVTQTAKKSSLNSKNYQGAITEDKNSDGQHIRRFVSARNSVNMKNHDKDSGRETSIRILLNHVNGKSSQENVLGSVCNKAGRSYTTTGKSSRLVNGRANHDSGSPLKSDVSNGRGSQSPGPKKPVYGGRRPPSGSKKFSGVCKVPWSEVAETALITKPNTHLTTTRNGLYKDLNQLLQHSRTLPADDGVSGLLFLMLTVDLVRFISVGIVARQQIRQLWNHGSEFEAGRRGFLFTKSSRPTRGPTQLPN